MKNKLIDLNDHLFAQLERLGNEELTLADLEKEAARSKAITSISKQIVGNARLAFEVEKFKANGMTINQKMPPMLEMKNNG